MKALRLMLALLALGAPSAAGQNDLVIRLQTALQRTGCLQGEPDGLWGAGSKAALAKFLRAIQEDVQNLEPTPAYLALAEATFGTICSDTDGGSAKEPPASLGPPLGSPTASCILATVSVGNKPQLGAWDFGSGPDTVLTETTTGSTGMCKDSHTCTIKIIDPPGTLFFVAVEQDGVGEDDPIGQGTCTGQVECSLPPAATVSLSSC